MELCAIFAWILSQGGAAILANFLMDKVPWLRNIADMLWKRIAAFIVAAIIAMVVFVLSVGVTCSPAPADWLGWLNQLTLVVTTAIGLSQILHAAVHDRQERANGP